MSSSDTTGAGANTSPCEICGEPSIPATTVCQLCVPVIAGLKRFVRLRNGRRLIHIVLNEYNRERRNVGEAAVREL